VELAVFAGVVKGDVAVGAAFALVDFAGVERLGIDVDADGAPIKFRQIQDLVDRLERVDVDGVRAVHLVDFRGNDFASAAGGVFFFDAKILDFQAADRGGHPAILIAMIVDAAVLADFPADGHTLEEVVFENKVARVIALGEEEIFFERLGADGVMDDVVLNILESEFALGDCSEAFDPVGDGELLDGKLFLHGRKIITLKRGSDDVKKQ
jgi:hypothetical protein